MKLTIAFLSLIVLSGCASNLQKEHFTAYKNHTYTTDQAKYNKADVWTPSLNGDCEDYALYMRQRAGGNLLHVTTQQGEAHMVLDVNGTIVDNLSKVVYPRSEMKHKIVYQLTETHIRQFLKARGLNSK